MQKKNKFFKTSTKRKIRYHYLNKQSDLTLVFFHGFMSDMLGKKPKIILQLAKKIKCNCLIFEYSGHGKSSDNFENGTISKWTNDAKQIIKKIHKKNKLIFIGSSMGSWIALNLFKVFKKYLVGFVGIASAPDFTELLMWNKFNKSLKKKLFKEKIIFIKNEYGSEYPITKNLILDGKKNKVLNKFKINLPVILFHGTHDQSVPIIISKKTLKNFKGNYKKLYIIKKGDHSLSNKKNLKFITTKIKELIKYIN